MTPLFLVAGTIAAADTPADNAAPREEAIERAPIEVLGSRISRPAAQIDSPPDLHETLPVDALDLIDQLPDVRATSTAGAGGTSFVSIRGGEPNFAQVLIDGVRVSNPSSTAGGGFDFAQLDPALIDTVSVIPASRSAVYGSDALSGVISLQLVAPSANRASFGGVLRADSEEGYGAFLRGSMGSDNSSLLLAAGLSDSGALTQGSHMERQQLLGRVSHSFGKLTLSSFALYGETEREGFPEASGGPDLAVNRALESRDTRFFAGGLTIEGDAALAVRPRLRVGYYDDNVRADTPAIFPGVFDAVPALYGDTDFDRLEVNADIGFALSDAFDLVAGFGYLSEDAQSTGTIDFGFLIPTGFGIERSQMSAFAEAEWRPIADLKVSAAMRRDWLEAEPNAETTAQATFQYSPGGGPFTVFAGYAEGFHQPSLFALAFPLTANPNLRPERSDAYEAGLRWRGNGSELRATIFRTDYTDLIDFDPVLFTTVNRSEVRSQGLTLSGSGAVGPDVTWFGSASWLDLDSAVPLRGRPEFYGNAGVRWRALDELTLSGDLRFNGDLLESSISTGVIELDGHVALDLAARWRASEQLSLSVALRNALDTEWQDAIGFPAPGRTVRAQLEFDF